MGNIWARIRGKRPTKDVLEKINSEILSIEEFIQHKHITQRRIRIQLYFIATLVYTTLIAAVYFYVCPSTFTKISLWLLGLLAFPVLTWLLGKVLTWFYQKKITKDEKKLKGLKEQRKKILDDVMEKETYKVAKEILEKFAPEQLQYKGKSMVLSSQSAAPTSLNLRPQISASSELRRRLTPALQHRPSAPDSLFTQTSQSSVSLRTNGQNTTIRTTSNVALPRPILARDRSALDKMIEYLMGDGPNNRYALICQQCNSHNGMALQEEFEFLSFRCCYCRHMNPARKQRPMAPRLPLHRGSERENESSSSSSEDSDVQETRSESGESASVSTSASVAAGSQDKVNMSVQENPDLTKEETTAETHEDNAPVEVQHNQEDGEEKLVEVSDKTDTAPEELTNAKGSKPETDLEDSEPPQ